MKNPWEKGFFYFQRINCPQLLRQTRPAGIS